MAEVTFVILGAELKPIISLPISKTFLELKQNIEDYTGVEIARQTLTFGTSKLKDSTRIDHYGFKDTATVNLTVLPTDHKLDISVSAAALGYEMEVKVKETDTVFELKRKIEECWNFDTEDMALWHLDVEMKDDYTLSKYYIHDGSQVKLRTPMLC